VKYPATINPNPARATPKITMARVFLPAKVDAATGAVWVAVGDGACTAGLSTEGDGARVAVGCNVFVAGGGIGVSVAGGCTCSSSFCPGMIMELALKLFQAINEPISTP